MLKGKRTDHAEDGLGVAHRARFLGKAATGPPVTAAGYVCTCGGFCGDAKTKKGGNTKSVFRLSSFYRDESFFVFTETEDTMKHILKRLIKANFRLERM